MKKYQLLLIAFPVILVSTNWFTSKSYDRSEGITGQSFDAAILGLIFTLASCWFLGRQAYKSFRHLLDEGIKIKKEESLVKIWPILLLTPLLFHSHATETKIMEDGATMTHIFGYGSDLRVSLFAFGALALVLIQVVAKLETKKGEQVGGHNSGKRSALTSA